MKKLDDYAALEEVENGGENQIAGLQALINSGLAWRLNGSTGRAAMGAIRAGLCALGPTDHRDAYGNHVPSRFQVKAGTKGSIQYVEDHGNTVQE